MLARTVDRVVGRTDPEVNDRIRRQAEMSLCYYRAHPEQISDRLRELDEEWDIERALEAMTSALSLMGFTWGVFRKRWWLIGLASQSFFMQHALQGWCPPLGVVRRLGFRTAHEIEAERFQLLALRDGSGSMSSTGAAPSRQEEPAFQPA